MGGDAQIRSTWPERGDMCYGLGQKWGTVIIAVTYRVISKCFTFTDILRDRVKWAKSFHR